MDWVNDRDLFVEHGTQLLSFHARSGLRPRLLGQLPFDRTTACGCRFCLQRHALGENLVLICEPGHGDREVEQEDEHERERDHEQGGRGVEDADRVR